MKTSTRIMLTTVAAMWAGISNAGAQDPVKQSPDTYKVLLENERVRVLEVRLKPGGKSPMHSHPPYVIYSLGNSTAKFTSPDGKTADAEMKKGDVMWRDAETHEVVNNGQTEAHVLNIEFKDTRSVAEHVMRTPSELKWSDSPPGLPPGGQVTVLEGDPKRPGPFTIRFKVPAGYRVPPHWHPADEHATLLSGKVIMGMGDQLDESKGSEFVAGSFMILPAGMPHFVSVKEDSIVQLHGIGPWGITYVNPADDPRGKTRQ